MNKYHFFQWNSWNILKYKTFITVFFQVKRKDVDYIYAKNDTRQIFYYAFSIDEKEMVSLEKLPIKAIQGYDENLYILVRYKSFI